MHTSIPESLMDEFRQWMDKEYVIVGGAWAY
jgi:hypothetical protein